MSKVKFAVVGVGRIGKRYLQVIGSNPQAEVVALIDIKSQEELGVTSFPGIFFASLHEFFEANIAVDVIVIATPNGLHALQAIECLNHNFNVVVEKPLAINSGDASEIIVASKNAGKKVFTVMQNRYSPPARWLKELVDQKVLGNIFMVQLNCFWNRDERYYTGNDWHGTLDLDGGILFTQFSHFIDIMYWLFGDIKKILSHQKNFNHGSTTQFPDSGVTLFELCNGAIGSLNYSTSVWDKNFLSEVIIIAEHGTVKVGGQYMDKVEYCHVKDYAFKGLPATAAGNDYGHYKGSAANHSFVIKNVIGVLRGDEMMDVSAEDGEIVVDIIERICQPSRY